jgi:HPt (histidine-containing phosphotransfer) domain-containing protein
MLSRFRDQLAEALAADDDMTARQARAHKIAGIGGTLGFADLSRTWLAVSEGDESAWEGARASARRAMRTIDADGDLTTDR